MVYSFVIKKKLILVKKIFVFEIIRQKVNVSNKIFVYIFFGFKTLFFKWHNSIVIVV